MKNYGLIRWIAILTTIWIILNGALTWSHIIGGIVCSIIILKFTDKYLLGLSFHVKHDFRLFKLLKYIAFMLKEIYMSGFEMIGMILTQNINPAVVDIETDLDNEYQRVLLANSITLTPGTITADLNGNKLKVLWINKTTDNPEELRQSISMSIEERLKNL